MGMADRNDMKSDMTPETRLDYLHQAVEMLLERAKAEEADPTERMKLSLQLDLVRGMPYTE